MVQAGLSEAGQAEEGQAEHCWSVFLLPVWLLQQQPWLLLQLLLWLLLWDFGCLLELRLSLLHMLLLKGLQS
jgi:hypothetical protein